MTKPEKSPWPLWISAISIAAFILAAVPFARPLQDRITHSWASGVIVLISILFGFAGCAVFYTMVWKNREKRIQNIIIFLVMSGLFALRILTLEVQVERFHILEYGLLTACVALGCRRLNLGWISYGWAMAACHLTGLADELFQYHWPERYGEWRDVMINNQGGFLALLALALLTIGTPVRRDNHKRWAALMAVLAVLAGLSGLFFLHVHGFGYAHYDSRTGWFKSVFTYDDLMSTTPDAYRDFVDALKADPNPPKELIQRQKTYEQEGRGHYDRTRLLLEQKNINDAAREYLITSIYYSGFLAVTGPEFSAHTQRMLSGVMPPRDHTHMSQPMDWLITRVTYFQVKWISILAVCFFMTVAAALLLRKKFAF